MFRMILGLSSVLLLCTSCRKPDAPAKPNRNATAVTQTNHGPQSFVPMNDAPDTGDIVQARLQFELAELEADARWSPGLATNLEDKDVAPLVKAQQLIFAGRLDEASKTAQQISLTSDRDAIFENIARTYLLQAMESRRFNAETEIEATDSDAFSPMEYVEKAGRAALKISNPGRRLETLGSLVSFALNQKAIPCIDKAIDLMQSSDGDLSTKARILVKASLGYLERKEIDKAKLCCQEAEAAAIGSGAGFETAMLNLDLIAIYALADDESQAIRLFKRMEPLLETIVDPREQATVLLAWADLFFHLRLKTENLSIREKLQEVKKNVLKIDQRIIQNAARRMSTNQNDPVFPKIRSHLTNDDDGRTRPLLWKEIGHKRNTLLLEIAQTQIRVGPLEDAWETIQDIDQDPQRDAAVCEVVEMFLEKNQPEEAEVWLEEIVDLRTREETSRKIQLAKQNE